jgi:hypothetical protein
MRWTWIVSNPLVTLSIDMKCPRRSVSTGYRSSSALRQRSDRCQFGAPYVSVLHAGGDSSVDTSLDTPDSRVNVLLSRSTRCPTSPPCLYQDKTGKAYLKRVCVTKMQHTLLSVIGE